MQKKNKFLSYRSEIDGLRAIAVVSVILYHAEIKFLDIEIFKGGFIGVDIFFVISGYLITSIIIKEIIKTGSFSLKYFYERRIRRIIPPLLFIMICSAPLAWIYLLPEDFILYSKSVLYSLGFVSNFFFLNIGTQYGAPDTLYLPMLHTWSLAVEEQFYILFPIFLILIYKILKKHYLIFFLTLFILSLLLAQYLSKNYPFINFFILPTRIFELTAGSLLAFFSVTKPHLTKNSFLNKYLPSFGLILVLLSIYFFDENTLHPSVFTLVPILGVCFIIFYSKKNEIVQKILSNKLFVSIGLISYSLYLWHYPIFAFARKAELLMGDPFKKIVLAVIILLLSILTFFLIEKPSRNQDYNFKKILSVLLFFVSVIVLYNYNVIKNKGYNFRVPDNLKINFSDAPWTLLKTQNDKNCHDWERGCVFYSFENKRTVNIIGDSQIGTLVYGLKNKLINNGYTFQSFTIGKCGFYPGFDLVNIKNNQISPNCNNKYFSKLKNTLNKQRDSVIVFGGKFQTHLDKKFDSQFVPNGEFLNIETSFSNEIKKLSKYNKIILLYPIPETYNDIRNKIYNLLKEKNNNFQNITNLTSISYADYKNRTKAAFEFLDSISGDNIYRIYPHKLFCNTKLYGNCISHDDENIFYHDSIHPSLKGAELINKLLINKILKLEVN